jgi:multiple sugar transport system ATP-binding protein
VGIRPEGFILHDQGSFQVRFGAVEVMGRDISIVSYSDASENPTIRSIIDSSNKVEPEGGIIRFALKPEKVHLFSKETEERIRVTRNR